MFTFQVAANSNVNFAAGWDKVWGAVTSGFPGVDIMLMAVGMILVVIAGVKYAWDRRRGGGNASPLWNTLIIGAILLLPGVVIPLALRLLSGLANIGIKVFAAVVPGS